MTRERGAPSFDPPISMAKSLERVNFYCSCYQNTLESIDNFSKLATWLAINNCTKRHENISFVRLKCGTVHQDARLQLIQL